MSRKKKREMEEQTLDLVPIMNLVTILIPFLLMSAQFVSLAVIDSSLPAITAEAPPAPDNEEEKLNLSVMITGNGFTIAGADMVLEKDSEENGPKVACLDAGCKSPESYDYEGLTARLSKIKDRFEDEPNVILVPGGRTPYEVLVLTMDACRNDQTDLDDENKARELFPFVVIAAGVN